MIITKAGTHFIKLQAGDTIVAVNPVSKESKEKGAKFGADMAFISLDHPDMNGASSVEFGEKKPFIISGPGEYEVKGVFAKGFASSSKFGLKGKEEKKQNTVYFLSMDNISFCFLGALSDEKLSEEALEAVEEIDILFVPVGEGMLTPSQAYKLAVSLESKIIIPLGAETEIKSFLKEAGAPKTESLEKLTLKKKDLDGKEGEVVLLKD